MRPFFLTSPQDDLSLNEGDADVVGLHRFAISAARRRVKEQQRRRKSKVVDLGWDMAAGRWSWGGSYGPLLQSSRRAEAQRRWLAFLCQHHARN